MTWRIQNCAPSKKYRLKFWVAVVVACRPIKKSTNTALLAFLNLGVKPQLWIWRFEGPFWPSNSLVSTIVDQIIVHQTIWIKFQLSKISAVLYIRLFLAPVNFFWVNKKTDFYEGLQILYLKLQAFLPESSWSFCPLKLKKSKGPE